MSAAKKTISVMVYSASDEKPGPREIERGNLAAMQAIVGGYIEKLDLKDGLNLICNEEGMINGLPALHAALAHWGTFQPICGTFFVCRNKGAEFASLREGDHALLANYVRPILV